MPNMAKVTIIGHVGADAELRMTRGGEPVSQFSVAVQAGRKDEQGKQSTNWYRVSVWGKQAAIAAEFVRRGDPLAVVGDLQVREYTDRTGVIRQSIEVRCDTFQLLAAKPQLLPTQEVEETLYGSPPAAPPHEEPSTPATV